MATAKPAQSAGCHYTVLTSHSLMHASIASKSLYLVDVMRVNVICSITTWRDLASLLSLAK
jgi:hypothetical protein